MKPGSTGNGGLRKPLETSGVLNAAQAHVTDNKSDSSIKSDGVQQLSKDVQCLRQEYKLLFNLGIKNNEDLIQFCIDAGIIPEGKMHKEFTTQIEYLKSQAIELYDSCKKIFKKIKYWETGVKDWADSKEAHGHLTGILGLAWNTIAREPGAFNHIQGKITGHQKKMDGYKKFTSEYFEKHSKAIEFIKNSEINIKDKQFNTDMKSFKGILGNCEQLSKYMTK